MTHHPVRRRPAPVGLLVSISISILVILVAACTAGSGHGGTAFAGKSRESSDAAPIRVGFLVLDGVYNSELVAPYDIFHHTVFHVQPGMEVFTVGRRAGVVETFEGLRVETEYDLESAPPIDVLVVPSAETNMSSDLDDARLIDWVRERGRSARYVLSICDGAFVLAQAGLLDGRSCTTFPGDIAAFRERFPKLNVVEGVRYVADGPAITGVGGARSYDPALHLVETLYGTKVAAGVARGMVIDWDPERVRHLAVDSGAGHPPAPRCYLPGERIDPATTVEDAAGRTMPLADIVTQAGDVKAVVLTILAGGEAKPVARRGGFWCEDTNNEIATIRHLRMKHGPAGILFIGVLCPPVAHEERFGYDAGSFLGRADGDEIYERNRRRFVEACERLRETDSLPFDVVVYDPRFRLLAATPPVDTRGPGTERPRWAGRLKWFEDTQTYGTPTVWVLTRDLQVPSPPFFMNVYESDGRKLRWRADDVTILLDRITAAR